ncbi:MAG: hypothetical protein ACYC63_10180 [Armatimonadota bacterium]
MRITLLLAFLFIFVTNLQAQQADLTSFDWGVMPSASAAAPDMSLRPRFVTDGKPETGWIAPADYQPLWLRLEWRFPVTIHQLTLRQFPESKHPDLGRLGKLALEADVQGRWQLIQTLDASATDPAQEIKLVLPQPVRTMAVRFVIQSATGKNIGVSEIKAFGAQPVMPMSYAHAWTGRWIWVEPSLRIPHREPIQRYLRRSFDLPDLKQVKEAWLIGTAYDRCTMWVNAHEALRDPSYAGGLMRRAQIKQIPLEWLQTGENVLAAKVEDLYEVGSQGLLAELILIAPDGTRTIIPTDNTWTGQEDSGLVPNWQKPGFKDPRYVPATIKAQANSRWHWAWNVLYPTLSPAETWKLTQVQTTPSPLRPGQPATATLTFEVPAKPKSDYAIIFRLGQHSLMREHDYELWGNALAPAAAKTSAWELGTHKVTIPLDIPPETPSPCPATILVSLPTTGVGLTTSLPNTQANQYGLHLKLPVDRGFIASAVGGASSPDFPRTQIKTLDGNPTLTIDGKPTAPMLWAAAYGNYRRYHENASTGVKLFRPTMAGGPIAAPGEDEEYFKYMFARLDAMINAAITIDPEIKLLPAIWADPQPDWLFINQSEQYLSARGVSLIPLVMTQPDVATVRDTFMSQAWRRDGAAGLTRLVKHMRSQPYAPHILGLILFAGRAGENYWGGNELNIFINEKGNYDAKPRDRWDLGDFSTAARRTFREFLIRRYQTNEALQQAWQRQDITFDDIIEPARFPREEVANILTWADKPKDAGTLRDPLQPGVGRLPMDYFECFSEAMVDTFITFGKAIKEASDDRLVVGCYAGYTLAHLFTNLPGFAGHTAVAKSVRSPYLDIFVSPAEYDQSRRAGGHLWGHNIIDSMRIHNKLWIYEADTRTYLSDIVPKQYSLKETIEVLRRDACASILRGSGWWWLEFSKEQRGANAREWFIDPEIQATATQLKKLYDFDLTLKDRGPSAQIAVFYHGNTHTAQDIFPPTIPLNVSIGRLTMVDGLQRLGAPYDLYSLADLPDLQKSGKLSQYKLCLMANAFYLQPEELKWLELLKQDGRTVVWLYTPGLAQNDKHLDAQNIAKIVEMPGVRLSTESLVPTVRLTQSPVTAGLPAGYELAPRAFAPGTTWERFGNNISPIPYLDPKADPQTQIVGNWVIDGEVKPDMGGFAIKRLPQWTSVYSPIPYLSIEVMRNLAKMAGVHVYRDSNDILYADKHFVCVHTADKPATDTLKLPAKTPVYEVFTGKLISPGADSIKLDIPPYTTALYYLGDPSKLQSAMK